MRIGFNGGGGHRTVGSIVDEARRAAADGFQSYWLSQIAGPDSLTALAVVGTSVPGIELGTSIVPIYGRHPFVLASQALTTQSACGGRLVLGIGASHQIVVEHLLGESYRRSYTRLRETVDALQPLLAGREASVEGKEIVARGTVAIDAPAPSVLVAALGPRSLALAGSRCDGVTLWMVGPHTVRDHVVPHLSEAAAQAGRGAPRVLAGAPLCVTEDVAAARRHAAGQLAVYGSLPAYQAMLEREGFNGPEDLLMAGSGDDIDRRIEAYRAAGVTDMRLAPMCPTENERERTREYLVGLCRRSGLA